MGHVFLVGCLFVDFPRTSSGLMITCARAHPHTHSVPACIFIFYNVIYYILQYIIIIYDILFSNILYNIYGIIYNIKYYIYLNSIYVIHQFGRYIVYVYMNLTYNARNILQIIINYIHKVWRNYSFYFSASKHIQRFIWCRYRVLVSTSQHTKCRLIALTTTKLLSYLRSAKVISSMMAGAWFAEGIRQLIYHLQGTLSQSQCFVIL